MRACSVAALGVRKKCSVSEIDPHHQGFALIPGVVQLSWTKEGKTTIIDWKSTARQQEISHVCNVGKAESALSREAGEGYPRRQSSLDLCVRRPLPRGLGIAGTRTGRSLHGEQRRTRLLAEVLRPSAGHWPPEDHGARRTHTRPRLTAFAPALTSRNPPPIAGEGFSIHIKKTGVARTPGFLCVAEYQANRCGWCAKNVIHAALATPER